MEIQNIDTMMIVDYQGALINWDNQELIKLANDTTVKYKGLIVTEEMVKDISKEVATLNNLIKKIDDKRKWIKKDYTAPLTIFENNVKEVTAIINGAIADLKSQLDIFEQERKAEKLIKIRKIMNIIHKEEFIQLPHDYNYRIVIHDNFYNKTIKDKEIEDNIRQQYTILINIYELDQLKIQNEKEHIERETIERENKIKNRYELIHKMNAETGCKFNYEETKHYCDVELLSVYQKAVLACINIEKMESEELSKQFNNKLLEKSYSLLIENLTEQEIKQIRELLTFSNALIKEI